MFDKEAQRQRAINQTAQFLKHGHTPPVAPIPVPKVEVPKDMRCTPFKVGQKVARAVKDGNSMGIRICTVTHVAGPQVYVDGSMRPIGKPERLLVL